LANCVRAFFSFPFRCEMDAGRQNEAEKEQTSSSNQLKIDCCRCICWWWPSKCLAAGWRDSLAKRCYLPLNQSIRMAQSVRASQCFSLALARAKQIKVVSKGNGHLDILIKSTGKL